MMKKYSYCLQRNSTCSEHIRMTPMSASKKVLAFASIHSQVQTKLRKMQYTSPPLAPVLPPQYHARESKLHVRALTAPSDKVTVEKMDFCGRWTSHENLLRSPRKLLLRGLLISVLICYGFICLPLLKVLITTLTQQDSGLTRNCTEANITIVSAFFDIGDFPKGHGERKISLYLMYSWPLAYIHTPLVFYTDSRTFENYIIQIRSRLHPDLTRVVRIRRDMLWSFGLRDPIAKLYSEKDYPKFAPNTVMSEYSCTQHSKYALLLDLILERHDVIKTDVYAWIDLGYFRYLRDNCDYCLVLPQNFSRSKVSFNQIYEPDFKLSPKAIFYGNKVWVGGGMFVATRDTMVAFCLEYQRATNFWLFQRNLSSTDQQIIYASFTEDGRRDVGFRIELQVNLGEHGWFHLGTSCLYLITNDSSSCLHGDDHGIFS